MKPPPTIQLMNADEIQNFMANFTAELTRTQEFARRQPQGEHATTNTLRPLIEQVRDLLASLPPAQKERVSLPLLLPHLEGKYRDHPHLQQVARAMRQLGWHQVRSWAKADAGHRYWVKETNDD